MWRLLWVGVSNWIFNEKLLKKFLAINKSSSRADKNQWILSTTDIEPVFFETLPFFISEVVMFPTENDIKTKIVWLPYTKKEQLNQKDNSRSLDTFTLTPQNHHQFLHHIIIATTFSRAISKPTGSVPTVLVLGNQLNLKASRSSEDHIENNNCT